MNYQHIRNATAIIEFAGVTFLIDPFLSPKGALPTVLSQYNELKNPIVDLPCAVEDIIKGIDAVIVTHMHHFDHFDEVARTVLDKNLPIFTQNEREQQDMLALGFKEVQVLLDEGSSFRSIQLYKTVAEHGRQSEAQSFYDAKGISGEASGVVLSHRDEGMLYLAGDTLWNDAVEKTVRQFAPSTIVLNAARAEFFGGIPILMGTEGILHARKISPNARIIVVHLEAVNHTRITRAEVKQFLHEHQMTENIYVPNDGEMLSFVGGQKVSDV